MNFATISISILSVCVCVEENENENVNIKEDKEKDEIDEIYSTKKRKLDDDSLIVQNCFEIVKEYDFNKKNKLSDDAADFVAENEEKNKNGYKTKIAIQHDNKKNKNNLENLIKSAGEKHGFYVEKHQTRFQYGTVYVETFLIIKKWKIKIIRRNSILFFNFLYAK